MKLFKFERNMRALSRSSRGAIRSSVSNRSIMMTEMLLLLFRILSVSFLALRFLISFLSSLGGAPKIDLPLSMFLLVKTVLTSLFSNSTFLVGEIKIVVLVEAILE